MSQVIAGERENRQSLYRRLYQFVRKEIYYNFILYFFVRSKMKHTEQSVEKSQFHTYTAFYRSPGQLQVFLEAVSKIMASKKGDSEPSLEINIFAGSNGAEAYTFTSVLLEKFPDIKVTVRCSDLHDDMVNYAKDGVYQASEVQEAEMPPHFISSTFDKVDGAFHVKPHIKDKISFFTANIVTDDLVQKYTAADIILIQNVLFHLDDASARKAFENVMATAKADAVVLMDGMPLDMREELVKQYQLKAVRSRIREIHEHARGHVPEDWWNYYYGAEPYLFFKPNKINRYCTVFNYQAKRA